MDSPDSQIGAYRLEEELGRGAMGIVFRAEPSSGGDAVALKLLKEQLSENETFVRRFLREARVAAEVEHPNLVRVLEAGEANGRHYLAVEYIAGGTLRRRLDADGPLTLEQTTRLARQIGTALDALHEAGLVHRDVKPENVMLEEGRALLADYGLAKGPAYTVLTRPGQVMGTPAYMAPELVNGEEATPATDLYALGCVLFESLAGRPPFTGSNVFELLVSHVEREPPSVAAVRDDVPASVDEVLGRALAKEAAGRPPTGRMLAHMLASATS